MPGFSSQEIIATAGASPFCARTATFNVRVSNSARDAVLATGRSSGGGTIFADRLASRGCDLVEGPRNKDRLETNASRLARLESRQLRDGSIGLFVDNAGARFRSKDDLAAEAMTRALERSVEKQRRYTKLNDLVSDYLSGRHCADRARGCALAALAADIVRQGEGVRGALTTYVRGQLDRFTSLLRNGAAASRRRRAITTLAGMVGALTLARAVDDPALSEEILTVAREAFGGTRRAADRQRCHAAREWHSAQFSGQTRKSRAARAASSPSALPTGQNRSYLCASSGSPGKLV